MSCQRVSFLHVGATGRFLVLALRGTPLVFLAHSVSVGRREGTFSQHVCELGGLPFNRPPSPEPRQKFRGNGLWAPKQTGPAEAVGHGSVASSLEVAGDKHREHWECAKSPLGLSSVAPGGGTDTRVTRCDSEVIWMHPCERHSGYT